MSVNDSGSASVGPFPSIRHLRLRWTDANPARVTTGDESMYRTFPGIQAKPPHGLPWDQAWASPIGLRPVDCLR
jgi:hypothetical protein